MKMISMKFRRLKPPDKKQLEHIRFVVTVKMCSFGGMIFVNGYNCFLLRGLAENKVLGINVDYDEETNTVLIYTE